MAVEEKRKNIKKPAYPFGRERAGWQAPAETLDLAGGIQPLTRNRREPGLTRGYCCASSGWSFSKLAMSSPSPSLLRFQVMLPVSTTARV
ncbi:MAG: hypothetical protein JWQ72_1596, partial [Polaromonas sp.]|nr:hypothetical protein [Polaromonas sp.]